jgi:uncharacterized phiE125 gp8 family phage protein
MSGLKIVTGPAATPVSRTEARNHLRLDDDVDDSQVRSYIQSATNYVENYTGRFLISRTCQMMLDGRLNVEEQIYNGYRTGHSSIPYVGHIEIAANPVISVESIKYYSDDDTEYTWAASNYYVDTFSEPAKIVLRDGGTYPSDMRAANGLAINFTAGYGASPSSIPEDIRVAILQYITFLYEHRGDFERFPPPKPPLVLSSLLNPYRILRFGAHPYSAIRMTGIG